MKQTSNRISLGAAEVSTITSRIIEGHVSLGLKIKWMFKKYVLQSKVGAFTNSVELSELFLSEVIEITFKTRKVR